jgi:predicted PolB exonuclease-like 3'-5' exonuclease
MFAQLKPEELLFIDIETVPAEPAFAQLEEPMRELWAQKAQQLSRGDKSPEEFYERAGIYAEFGKIVCVSLGVLYRKGEERYGIRLKSICHADERVLLEKLNDLLENKINGKQRCLCGHNIREFDIPYLCRRMLVNDLCIPKLVDCTGLKPWEVPHLDTMQLWRFGDMKSFTSLNLLATLFRIPSPKGDINGADVGRVFYEEGDLGRISRYCQQDVLTVAQLLLRFKSLPLIQPSDVEYA